jgi:hypothetical protein
MRWVAWRQSRAAIVALAVIEIAFSVVAWYQAHQIQGLNSQLVRLRCDSSGAPACGPLFGQVRQWDHWNVLVALAAIAIAVVAGAVIASSAVVGDLDRMSVRLGWTQSLTRPQWFREKAGIGVLTVVGLIVPLSIVLAWWNATTGYQPRVSVFGMSLSGGLLVCYGLVAFALVVAAGAVIRRTGWAIAIGVVAFLAVFLAASSLESSILVQQATATAYYSNDPVPGTPPGSFQTFHTGTPSGAWVTNSGWAPRHYRGIPSAAVFNESTQRLTSCTNSISACESKLQLRQVEVYVADGEFPRLQVEEGLSLLVGTALLLGAGLLRLRRLDA